MLTRAKLGLQASSSRSQQVRTPDPTSQLKLWAENHSAFGVDKLSLVEAKPVGVNPFNYVNITDFNATINRSDVNDLAHLTVKLW